MQHQGLSFWARQLPETPGQELGAGWTFHPVVSEFQCALGAVSIYWCALEPGCSPHPAHAHQEHELLIIYAGELAVTHANGQTTARRFDLVYHPAGCSHTVHNCGSETARFLVLKWRAQPEDAVAGLASTILNVPSPVLPQRGEPNHACEVARFQISDKFDLLYQACCFAEGNGFRIHRHEFDVFQMIFTGRVIGLGHRSSAPSLLYFAEGVPHGFTEPCPEPVYSHAVQILPRARADDMGMMVKRCASGGCRCN